MDEVDQSKDSDDSGKDSDVWLLIKAEAGGNRKAGCERIRRNQA